MPVAPKSHAWLLARLTMSTPARRKAVALTAGAWKAKQVGVGLGHFELPPEPKVPSRFTAVRSARRIAGATPASIPTAWPGGIPYDDPSVTSPPQITVSGCPGGSFAPTAASA